MTGRTMMYMSLGQLQKQTEVMTLNREKDLASAIFFNCNRVLNQSLMLSKFLILLVWNIFRLLWLHVNFCFIFWLFRNMLSPLHFWIKGDFNNINLGGVLDVLLFIVILIIFDVTSMKKTHLCLWFIDFVTSWFFRWVTSC